MSNLKRNLTSDHAFNLFCYFFEVRTLWRNGLDVLVVNLLTVLTVQYLQEHARTHTMFLFFFMFFETYAWKTWALCSKIHTHARAHISMDFIVFFLFKFRFMHGKHGHYTASKDTHTQFCFAPFACHFSLDHSAEMPREAEVWVARTNPDCCDDENGWRWRK